MDWSKANWDLPQLQRLKQLSELSNFDLPQAKLETLDGESDKRLRLQHTVAMPITQLSRTAVEAPLNHRVTVDLHRDLAQTSSVSEMVQRKRIDAVSPQVLQQTQLLGLSDLSTKDDAALMELIGHVADQHILDPEMAQRIVASRVHYRPVNRAELMATLEGTRGENSGGVDGFLTSLHSHTTDHVRCFHTSDIVSYPVIRSDMEEEWKVDQRLESCTAPVLTASPPAVTAPEEGRLTVPTAGEGDIPAGEASSPAIPPSMHDCGYQTWMQRHLDQQCDDESDEKMEDYLESLTTWEGRKMAVEERLKCLHEDRSPYRKRVLEELQARPAITQ